MNAVHRDCVWVVLLAASLAAAGSGRAQEKPQAGNERLRRLLDQSLPPVLGEQNSDLVGRLLKAAMGKPLRQSFNLDGAVRGIFGDEKPRFSPGCQPNRTAVNEPDEGECVAEVGEEAGTGSYTRLAFSNNLGLGNIALLRRPAGRDLKPEELGPVKMSDPEAYEKAQSFLRATFGLDLAEVPKPPSDARALPVSTLDIGFGSEGRPEALPPVSVQKVVRLRRGLAVDGISDRRSGRTLPYVPAPGTATVVLDDRGVVAAVVEDWQELRVDPRMDPRNAKTRRELINEIAQDLASEGIVAPARITCLLVLSSDWRGTHGFLLPSIQVFVSPVPLDLNERQQRALARRGTAGFVREYSLVHRKPEELEER